MTTRDLHPRPTPLHDEHSLRIHFPELIGLGEPINSGRCGNPPLANNAEIERVGRARKPHSRITRLAPTASTARPLAVRRKTTILRLLNGADISRFNAQGCILRGLFGANPDLIFR